MLLEINDSDKIAITLHRTNRSTVGEKLLEHEKELEAFLFGVFDLNKVEGLACYSRKDIERITIDLLNEIDRAILKQARCVPLEKVIAHLKEKYRLEFDFENRIVEPDEKEILGLYSINENKIQIDCSVRNTERFSFLVSHEIGHFLLHRNLKINKRAYENFKDAEYDFASNKYLLNNHKNWIEWQANEFAANLIMPNLSFYNRLLQIQEMLGISKRGHIFLDDQPINRKDFGDITTYLSTFFNTTYTSVILKLEALNLITYNRNLDSYKEEIRNIFLTHRVCLIQALT